MEFCNYYETECRAAHGGRECQTEDGLRSCMDCPHRDRDMRICPACGREVERRDMEFTKDCQGIPFRLLCWECYQKAMLKGYDGEYYDERDEQIEADY